MAGCTFRSTKNPLAIFPAANIGKSRTTEAWPRVRQICSVQKINGVIALLLSAATLKCVVGLGPASVVIYVVFFLTQCARGMEVRTFRVKNVDVVDFESGVCSNSDF